MRLEPEPVVVQPAGDGNAYDATPVSASVALAATSSEPDAPGAERKKAIAPEPG